MTIKYFSMFSGIGGFEYGMEQSKIGKEFECVGFSEIDRYAESIYKKNYPNHINYGDATKIRTEELPDFEFLVGGFPCQSFSIAGKQKGFNDTRGTLFFEIARVLKDKKPRYFLLENVKNLLSHDGGNTITRIFEVLNELRYDVSWSVYNSKNYGVPQSRERIFIKGYLRGKCGQEILHQPRDCTEVDGKLSNTYYGNRSGRIHEPEELMNALCCSGHNGAGKQWVKLDNPQSQLLNSASDGTVACIDANYHKGLSPSDVKKNRRKRTHIVESESDYLVRRLTPVECERLQGFPDNYTKYGVNGELISDTQRYKCLGNAVTTNVVKAIINEVFYEYEEVSE